MRLLVLYGDTPVPPNHGGRVDVYQRLLALKKAGVEVSLVCWYSPKLGETAEAVVAGLGDTVAEVQVFPYRSFLRRPWLLLAYPGWIAARYLDRTGLARVLDASRRFRPDAILIDGLPCAAAGLQVASALRMPYFFRSHNREYDYFRGQLPLNHGWKARLRVRLNLLGLQRFERRVLGGARTFFDISEGDLQTWRREGLTNGEWMPPVMDPDHARALSDQSNWAPTLDVGYLGNLINPNNVHGVLWFVREVVPLLMQRRPGITIQIAGSQPIPAIVDACQAAGVKLLPNPAKAASVLRDCRVLVNPVFQGSGVNLKSIEMLHAPAALVSTTAGIAGMPAAAIDQFVVADTADAFARAIVEVLDRQPLGSAGSARQAARDLFSPLQVVGPMLRQMASEPECRPERRPS